MKMNIEIFIMQNAGTAINGATVAVTATLESNFVEVDASAWTNNKVVLQIKTTNANAAYLQGESLTVNWAWAADTGLLNSTTLKATTSSITIPCPIAASEVRYNVTSQAPVLGSRLYIWLSHPVWNNTRTVTVSYGTLL